MEHGNRWDPEKMLAVSVSADTSYLEISITDEGAGFDTSLVSEAAGPAALKIRGRGIRLIRQFCTPRWNKRGNQIRLLVDLKR